MGQQALWKTSDASCLEDLLFGIFLEWSLTARRAGWDIGQTLVLLLARGTQRAPFYRQMLG